MPRTRGHHIPLLVTAPGFGWINAYTVASEIGDIERLDRRRSCATTTKAALSMH
jgi:hypothetical protein